MIELGIRVARPGDYDSIVAVVDHWWERPVCPSLPRLFLDHFWSTSRIAQDQRGLAGFLVAFVSPSQPHLGYLHFAGVRPDHRRNGLARQLYGEFADQAAEQGCTELHAITAPDNIGSIRFHRSLGFAVSEPLPDYNGPDRTMVSFWLQLDPTSATSSRSAFGTHPVGPQRG
jgi:ribosomal protein S18 acetylase RimI-like enzyme